MPASRRRSPCRDAGFETVMVNSNPETVSTDYDTSDRLYFEPLTVEDVLAVCEAERPLGVIVQLGGQTPLAMAAELERAGVPILGTTTARRWTWPRTARSSGCSCGSSGIPSPAHGVAPSVEEAAQVAARIGYPAASSGRRTCWAAGPWTSCIRPRSSRRSWRRRRPPAPSTRCSWTDSWRGRWRSTSTPWPTGSEVLIGAVMEHIEEAGVHSGRLALRDPPRHTLGGGARRASRRPSSPSPGASASGAC